MKRILVPLDLGPNTLSLFEYAEPFASEIGASLLLLHVIHKQAYDNGTFSPGTSVHQCMVQEARMILEQLSRKAIGHGICSKIMITDGDPEKVILETAKAFKVEMIVVSAVSKNDIRTYRILSQAACPVLTYLPNEPMKPAVRPTSPRKYKDEDVFDSALSLQTA